MAEYGGWTGKTLRVDLSTGKITTEDTIAKYKDYLGGTGVGYKVLFDEVPVGTKAWDPENRIIFGVGPFTGTGAPTSARVQITSLFPPNMDELPGSGHMGGHWGAALKYAGWDNIIVQGKAKNPVWIAIEDDKVEIRDASRIWGSGIFRATAEICAEMGEGAHVAAIGQAGENLNRYSVVICDRSHSAGGIGGVLGSKNLKAIGVRGTGSVKIAAKPAEWEELINHYVAMMGANNQHVVPRNKEPWAEYSAGTRWTGSKGVYWGAADPPLEIGYCPGEDLNKIGYRTQKGILDHGNPVGQTHFVRGDGCHSCPIRCHVMMDVAELEQYGVGRYQGNTCLGNSGGRSFYAKTPGSGTKERLILSTLGSALMDDYGLWLGYSAETQVFTYLHGKGFWKEKLDEKEYESIPWDLMEAQDPAWLLDIVPRVAYQKGVLGQAMAEGPAWMVKRWPELAELFTAEGAPHFWKPWHGYHHSIESGGQVGAILCMLWNRDHNSHVHLNFYGMACRWRSSRRSGRRSSARKMPSPPTTTTGHSTKPKRASRLRPSSTPSCTTR